MNTDGPPFLYRLFRFILAQRYWVVGIYALLLVPSVYFAIKVEQDNAIDRLIVKTDPDYLASRRFDKVFGASEYVVLVTEAADPYQPEVLSKFAALEAGLATLPRVTVNSALTLFRQAQPSFTPTAEYGARFRAFNEGTDLLRKQGLCGPGFLSIPLVMDVKSTAERAEVLRGVEVVIDRVLGKSAPAPFSALRRVGQPYVNDYLDRDTRAAGIRYFPLFGLFVLILNLVLYRSWKALVAFLIALGASAAMTVGFVGITGGVFTIVSSLVPMTILITCTATLVYLHSRYVERPPERSVEDHLVFALVNKFLACTASIFATAVGFAALAVSKIRPIRELGLWVAAGLVFTWLIVFTLFPALVRILNAPTAGERKVAGDFFLRFVRWLPPFSYRFRWILVPGSLFLCALGATALFGIPKVLPPMKLQTNAIEYVNHNSALYKDTKRMEQVIGGLSVTEVWLQAKDPKQIGLLTKPQVLRGLDRFQRLLEADKRIGATAGLASILRILRYISGKGDALPSDDEALEDVAFTVAEELPRQPLLRRFVNGGNLTQTHVSVITPTVDFEAFQQVKLAIELAFSKAKAEVPALDAFTLEEVGVAPLQAKISYHLVPTLVESFWLTVVIIFMTFLVVFRNGAARVMAMIPSLFAILVMFGLMRLFGMTLNVATILIASTVLGTSENDQIHFFYHFQEGRQQGQSTEAALRHTLLIAGKAIFFATLINAGGFMAFSLADLPPIRQFGVLSSLAFVLSMIADFTALPAALWLVFRERPDALKDDAPKG